MISGKGPKGGVALASSADDITLLDVVKAIDGLSFFHDCLLGLGDCEDGRPCPLHQEWGELREKIKVIFEETSLAEMAEKVKNNGFRLAIDNNDI